MRAVFSSAFICLLALAASHAGEWKLISPSPVASHLHTLALAPDGHPIAMGSFGNAASAEDGVAWNPLTLPTARTVEQAMFKDGVGHAVGRGGTLLVSRDGGRAWKAQAGGIQADLYGVDFFDAARGSACGDGTLLRTWDGGETWRAIHSGLSVGWRRVEMTGENSLVVAGWGGIYRSVDGGVTFATALRHDIPFESMDFADSFTGFAASYATLWRTRDGGATWDSVFFTSVITGVQAFTRDSVYVFGPSGLRGRSTDGGGTWDTDFDWEPRDMLETRFADALAGYGVGNNGNIYGTLDGGRTWTARHASEQVRLRSAPQFFDGHSGYALGASGPMRTENGGLTWRADTGTIVPLAQNGFHLVDAKVGYGAGNGGALIRTGDAGRTWARLETGTTRALASVWFAHPDTGWVAGKGANAQILKTVDGGRHWQAQSNPSQAPLSLIRFRDTRRGYALGGNDQLLTTYNGGQDWIVSAFKFPHAPDFLEVAPDGTLFARGISDTAAFLLKSVNGGATWTAKPFSDDIQSIHFIHADTGFAAGATRGGERQGVILRTVDGGATWARTETATPELNEVFFPAPGTGVALGPYGTVLTRGGEADAHATLVLPRRSSELRRGNKPGRYARPGEGFWVDALGIRLR